MSRLSDSKSSKEGTGTEWSENECGTGKQLKYTLLGPTIPVSRKGMPSEILSSQAAKEFSSHRAKALQIAEEFCKIRKPKISKLKEGYSVNAMLIFNLWMKDIFFIDSKDIAVFVHHRKLCNLEAVQLVKHYTVDHVQSATEFYLDTNTSWQYHDLLDHLHVSFELGKVLAL